MFLFLILGQRGDPRDRSAQPFLQTELYEEDFEVLPHFHLHGQMALDHHRCSGGVDDHHDDHVAHVEYCSLPDSRSAR